VEGEALAVEPRAHQPEQDGGGADQRHDADAEGVRACHQAGAGVGHRRATGVREQAEVRAGERGGEQRVERRVGGLGGQLADVRVAQRVGIVELLEVGARRARGLDDEVAQAGGDRLCLRGQEVCPRCVLAQGHRDQVEVPARHGVAAHGSCTPAVRSMRARAISGRPISAVGSSPRIASSSAMPRPSDLALPAQSSGRSRST
jgi:hypothetical protein